MANPDQLPTAAYLSAIVVYIVLLTIGLISNAVVLGTILVDVRRWPGHPHHVRVNMDQIAIGLPCVANVLGGIFSVAWFTYVGIASTEYLRHLQPACRVVSALFVWTSVMYMMGLLTMSVDRVLAVRRHRLRLPADDEDRSVEISTRGVWLTVVGFTLYASTVCIVLTASRSLNISTTMLCTVYVDDRYFWIIAAGYMLPFVVIIGCMVAATVMICRLDPPPTVQDDGQVIEEEVNGWLKEQRRMLKFLTALVVCWIIGNVPLMYVLRGPPSIIVEVSLVLVLISHQLALPMAMLVWRRRLWSLVRRFVRAVRRRKPRTVSHSDTPTDYRGDEEDAGNNSGVGNPSSERPGPSSCTVGDAPLELESRSAHDSINEGRCVKFDSEAVHVHQEGQHYSEDVDELQGDVATHLLQIIQSQDMREWMSAADDDVKRDDVSEGTSAAADIEVTDRHEFSKLKNDVSPGRSSKSAEIPAANFCVNCDNKPTSEWQCEVGDTSVEKLSVPDPELDMDRRGHAENSECGLGDAAESSLSIYELSDEAQLIYEKPDIDSNEK